MSKQIAVTGTQDTETTGRKAKRPRLRQRKGIILLSLLVIILLGAIGLLFAKYQHVQNNNPANQQKALTEQLHELAELPPEQPVISTVLDTSKLTNPALAKRAKNGDTLFIFPESKRLILYRSSDKKVVDMLTIQS